MYGWIGTLPPGGQRDSKLITAQSWEDYCCCCSASAGRWSWSACTSGWTGWSACHIWGRRRAFRRCALECASCSPSVSGRSCSRSCTRTSLPLPPPARCALKVPSCIWTVRLPRPGSAEDAGVAGPLAAPFRWRNTPHLAGFHCPPMPMRSRKRTTHLGDGQDPCTRSRFPNLIWERFDRTPGIPD